MANIITKPFFNIDEQIRLLSGDRNLIIKDVVTAKKHLLEKNYFDLINGFETLLLEDPNDKAVGYKNKSFIDFLSLYNFDSELRKELLTVISSFEIKLKSSIAYHFCEKFCRNQLNNLAYLDKNNYVVPSGLGTKHPISQAFYKDSFAFFKQPYNARYANYVEYARNKHSYIGRYTNPPLWVIIKQLMLGDILFMIWYLDKDVLKNVLLDFNLTMSDVDLFKNSVEIIKDIRNSCAHFELINRFRTSSSISINAALATRLNLNVLQQQTNRTRYRIKLYDTLKVLGMYEDIFQVRRVIIRFYDRNISIRKKYLIMPLLDRMGASDIKDWKKLK